MYEPKEKIDLERAKKLEAEAKKIRKKAKEIEKHNQLIEDANFGITCKNILTKKDLENLETLLSKFSQYTKRKCEIKDLIKLGENYLTKMENAQTLQDQSREKVEIFPGGKNTTALTSPLKKENKKRAKELARVSFALSYAF